MSAWREREFSTRSEGARASNARVMAQAERHQFISRVPMVCECSDPSCRRILLISLEDYRQARKQDFYVVFPEHVVDGCAAVIRETDYWLSSRNDPHLVVH